MKIVMKKFLLFTQEQTFAKYDFIQDIDNACFVLIHCYLHCYFTFCCFYVLYYY